MGVYRETAHRADASRPAHREVEPDAVTWLPRARSRRSGHRVVLLALVLAGLALPQSAIAPAAVAHDRIDLNPRSVLDLLAADAPAEQLEELPPWQGLPVPEQQPTTTSLIADDLAALPRPDPEADAIRFGQRRVPRRVVETILKASEATGVDPVYMMALADKESSFDTDVKAATSSAKGLFQFVTATWLEMVRDYGARYGLAEEAAAVKGRGGAITVAAPLRERVLALRDDPYLSAVMAAEMAKRDRERVEAQVGRALSISEQYFAHFLGRSGASRFLGLTDGKPDQKATEAFRQAARANRSLFTERTEPGSGKSRRSLTVGEVYERIDGLIDARLNRYQGVAALAGAVEDRDEAPARPVEAPMDTDTHRARIQVTEALPPDGD